jgi:hypothetical protein
MAANHCCDTMAETADSLDELQASEVWRGSLVLFDPAEGAYGLTLAAAEEESYEPIRFCPWCGTDLIGKGRQST